MTITTHPAKSQEFYDSLRLLITEQKHNLTNVALMFGVSRERIRQHCEKSGIQHSPLMWWRIWDDEQNRFVPIRRMEYLRRQNRQRAVLYFDDLVQRRRERRERIMTALQQLRNELGREPFYHEWWMRYTGSPETPVNAASSFLHAWGGMRGITKQQIARFIRETGYTPHKQGHNPNVVAKMRLMQ